MRTPRSGAFWRFPFLNFQAGSDADRDGGKDAFVHISAVQRSGLDSLYENDKVEYDQESGREGKESAVNLKLL